MCRCPTDESRLFVTIQQLTSTLSPCFALLSVRQLFDAFIVQVLPLDEVIASRAVIVIVSGSDGLADEGSFGASEITQKR